MSLDVYLLGSSLLTTITQGCRRLCLLKVEATSAVQPAAPAQDCRGQPNSFGAPRATQAGIIE